MNAMNATEMSDPRTAWAWDRLKVLEDQRQDDAATIARLRAHLAAAGLALDELTKPAPAPTPAPEVSPR